MIMGSYGVGSLGMDATILWQFLAIFLAASLAFVLEDLRERRRTRRWVTRHLQHLSELATSETEESVRATSEAQHQLNALDAWLRAERGSDVTDEQWDAINNSWAANMIDLGPLLRSEALSVLTDDVATVLAKLEHTMRYIAVATDQLNRRQDAILDAWARREAPLPAPTARRVQLLRDSVANIMQLMPEAYSTTAELTDRVRQRRNRFATQRV